MGSTVRSRGERPDVAGPAKPENAPPVSRVPVVRHLTYVWFVIYISGDAGRGLGPLYWRCGPFRR